MMDVKKIITEDCMFNVEINVFGTKLLIDNTH